MINSVRSTVLSILNKNNFGYISPADFNNYCKQAQLEIFENYFSKINKQINLENVRQSGTDYANLVKKMSEDIEYFSSTNFLSHFANNIFYMPSLSTTGDSWFMTGKILCYTNELATGNTSSVVVNQLVDTAGAFTSKGIVANDIVVNVSTGDIARVISVVSATVISLTADIFTYAPEDYLILESASVKEAEKVTHGKVTMLNTSNLTMPNNTFPAYTLENSFITVYPSTVNSKGQVLSQYTRYPKDPKWTYVSLIGGEPSFDQSQPDYQDFELPQEEEPNLIIKILAYCGISIRETEVYQFAKMEERENDAK